MGLGSPANARRFSEVLQFPLDILYADETGQCYKALGFSPGFAPAAGVSPYLKLLPMLAGIGSPGTIQEVSQLPLIASLSSSSGPWRKAADAQGSRAGRGSAVQHDRAKASAAP